MKKATYLILALIMVLSVTGCGSKAAEEENPAVPKMSNDLPGSEPVIYGKITEIKENLFVTQVEDIYINASDYLGTMIKLEGLYYSDVNPGGDRMYHLVYRYAPGCCPGEIMMCGFEVQYDSEYPEQNARVEVLGVLEWYEEDGQSYLYLNLLSLKALEDREQEQEFMQ
jgi:putative membrane protein